MNWLTDFPHLSRLIIKEVWQSPHLRLLSLFFIHGRKLLIAAHQGQHTKREHPAPSLLLMSRGEGITEIKDLKKECWDSTLLFTDWISVANTVNDIKSTSLSRAYWTHSDSMFWWIMSWLKVFITVRAHSDPEWVTLSLQDSFSPENYKFPWKCVNV